MTSLGKPLVFYLKYISEMDHLYAYPAYRGGQPDLTGLNEAEQVQEMAKLVGASAHNQAADFLERCGEGIVDHFTGLGIATLASKKKRATIVRDWFWRVEVRVPSVRDAWFSCGVWITAPPLGWKSPEKDVCGIVVPWLWAKGGSKAEDVMWSILGGCPHSREAKTLNLERGMVDLAWILISPRPPESFDVDRDPLIAEVIKTFARITAEQTKAIASFVSGLN